MAISAVPKGDHFFGFRVDFGRLIVVSREVVEMIFRKVLFGRRGPSFLGSQDHVDKVTHLGLAIAREPVDLT